MSTREEIVSTPMTAESAPTTLLDGVCVEPNTINSTKEPYGSFDALHDMQSDLSGWSFPDFWAFDLGGDF